MLEGREGKRRRFSPGGIAARVRVRGEPREEALPSRARVDRGALEEDAAKLRLSSWEVKVGALNCSLCKRGVGFAPESRWPEELRVSGCVIVAVNDRSLRVY